MLHDEILELARDLRERGLMETAHEAQHEARQHLLPWCWEMQDPQHDQGMQPCPTLRSRLRSELLVLQVVGLLIEIRVQKGIFMNRLA